MIQPYDVTKAFEERIADYTGAPYAIALDNCSNALFLALMYDNIAGKTIEIPCRTYMSVPCEIRHAGGFVKFSSPDGNTLKGAYQLKGSNVIDSALRFTANMYVPGSFMCCSFTGKYKPLKLGKGGCILTDNKEACLWFKRSRFSGRKETEYSEDDFSMMGWNFYMHPMIAELGLLLMGQFYNQDRSKKDTPDVEMEYPDLSQYKIYTDVL